MAAPEAWTRPVAPPAPERRSPHTRRVIGVVIAVVVVLAAIGVANEDGPTGQRGDAQVAAGTARATVTPTTAPPQTPTTIPTSTPTPQPPLEILSVRSEAAGIGGFAYAYVRITNHSDRTIAYVGIDGMCYDAAGVRRGDGIGNTSNVAPGEIVEITVIFMNAQDCTRVSVGFDDLTRLYI